jgi:hypothetical protein
MSGTPKKSGAGKAGAKASPGLMRNIGQFWGHVVQGIKSDPSPAGKPGAGQANLPPTVRHEVIERIQETPSGPVRIRRTIIEEVHEAVEQRPPPEHPEQAPGEAGEKVS